MFLKKFFLELKARRIVRKEYKKNKVLFDSIGLKRSWGGTLYRVINRDVDIELGSGEDEIYLRKELAEITAVLVKCGILDILAYELKPLEEVTPLEDGKEEFEHGYLVTLTPAWYLDKQYVTFGSVIGVILGFAFVIGGVIFSIFHWLIPYLQTVL